MSPFGPSGPRARVWGGPCRAPGAMAHWAKKIIKLEWRRSTVHLLSFPICVPSKRAYGRRQSARSFSILVNGCPYSSLRDGSAVAQGHPTRIEKPPLRHLPSRDPIMAGGRSYGSGLPCTSRSLHLPSQSLHTLPPTLTTSHPSLPTEKPPMRITPPPPITPASLCSKYLGWRQQTPAHEVFTVPKRGAV